MAVDLPRCFPLLANETYIGTSPRYIDTPTCRMVKWNCVPLPGVAASASEAWVAGSKPFDIRILMGRFQTWEQAQDRAAVSRLLWMAYVKDPTPEVQACIDEAKLQ